MSGGGPNVHVTRTATERAIEMVVEFIERDRGLAFGQSCQRHQKARRTEPALQPMVVTKRLLHRAQSAIGRSESFDRTDRSTIDLRSQHETGPHRETIEQHRARTAGPLLASDVGAGQLHTVSEEVGQQQSRLDLGLDGFAIDVDRDVMPGGRLGRRR